MTSSGSHKRMKVHWKDIMYKHGYNPLLAYKQAKLCNMLFAFGLNERFCSSGIRAYGIDPGLVKTDIGLKQTGGLVRLVWQLRKRRGVDTSIPARTYAHVLEEEKAPEGLYYYLCKEAPFSKEVNKANADRLWSLSEQLSGLSYGVKL
jgi:NAD(P)-dependent dehydrogenase (short-subunit alcohol dehydrogenase family)